MARSISYMASLLLTFTASAEPVSVDDISVVDGDTIDYRGERYRMIGYDTPEIQTPRRLVGPDEKALATIAIQIAAYSLGDRAVALF